jgi:hypothetical protein
MIAHVPNPGIMSPKFLLASTIVSMTFTSKNYHFIFFNLLFKHPRNSGDITPGFGTWSKSIVFIVKTFAV